MLHKLLDKNYTMKEGNSDTQYNTNVAGVILSVQRKVEILGAFIRDKITRDLFCLV